MKKNTLLLISIMLLFACNTQKEIPKSVSIQFRADKTEIVEGENTQLFWSASNSKKITISNIPSATELSGTVEVSPIKTTTYRLTAENESGVTTTKEITITVLPKPKPQKKTAPIINIKKDKNHIYSTGSDDGRYTLGGNNKRLMYGFPNPLSTSHFILKVDDFYAANTPHLSEEHDNVVYFKGERVISNEMGSIYTEITFMLDSIYITKVSELLIY